MLSPSVLARDVQAKVDGTLQMNGLRAYKDLQGYHAVGGRCLAHAKIVNEDGREDQLLFPSKYFHVIVRDTKEPFLPRVPDDCTLPHINFSNVPLFSLTCMAKPIP